jgi:RecA-family ATPase
MDLDLKTLARALGGHVSNGQVIAPGPGHSAADRSLSIKLSPTAPEGFVVHSFAGDDPIVCRDYVKEKCGIVQTDKSNGHHAAPISDDAIDRALREAIAKQQAPKPKGVLTNTFDYTDENAELLYQVLKYDPKDFRQRRPDGNGGFIWSLDGIHRVPYRWPELLKYPSGTVFVCEGEKDADRVASIKYCECATTVASGKWTDDCVQALAGRDCLVLEDNDETGRKKALEAATQVHGVANTIRIVRLPGLRDHEDVSDWLDADPRRAEKLVDICFDAPLWEPDGKPAAEETKSAESKKPEPPQQERPKLPFIDMSRWDDEQPPEREWAVQDRIPLLQTTLFSGEGAAGKSANLLHECIAHPLAGDWLRTLPAPGPSIFIECEDDQKELHRRSACVLQHYGATYREAINAGLHLMSFAGMDAVLATVSRSGKVEPTVIYSELLEQAGDIKPKMIGIASSANVFAGSENDRSQVQQFIGLTTRLAIVANGAVVLVSHPSLTGINSDSGLSGTTQWHNSVRARMYMKSVNPEPGEQPDTDLREIVFKKNNYGPISESIVLRYQNGLFLPVPGVSSLDRAAQEQTAEYVFLDLLKRFTAANRNVNDKRGPSYAPALFAREDEARKALLNSRSFDAAMRRLFADKKIWNEPYGRPSRPHFRIALKT